MIGEWSDKFNFTTAIYKEIVVLSPNGGEKFMAGDTIEIKWTDNIEENVRIKYLSGNLGFIFDISSSTESDGSFIWIIPELMQWRTNCIIGIESVTNSDIADYTDEYFSITEKIYPPIIFSQTEAVVVNREENAVFEIHADCMSGDSTGYQWVKKTKGSDDEILLVDLDGEITGATYKKLVIYNLKEEEDSTVYRCDLRNLRQYPDSGSTSQSKDILLRVKYIEIKSPGVDQIFFSDQSGVIEWERNFDEAVKIELFRGGSFGRHRWRIFNDDR